MMKLSSERIDEVLRGSKYEGAARDQIDNYGYMQPNNALLTLQSDMRINAAKSLLLERLCGEWLEASEKYNKAKALSDASAIHMATGEVTPQQRMEWGLKMDYAWDDVMKVVAQARELGIGE